MYASEQIVVVDTNFVGRGGFRSAQVSRLAARLARRGHALVVPEVVVWEWAQHAHSAATEASVAARRGSEAVDDRLGVGIHPVEVPPIEDLVSKIRALLSGMESVDLADSEPERALEALKGQVLQTGLGTRTRDGTKTGAADAMILGSVAALLESYETVVLCTADKLLAKAAGDLSGDVVVVADQRALWDWHGLTMPETDDLEPAVLAFVERTLREAVVERRHFPLFESGVSISEEVFKYAGVSTRETRQVDLLVETMQKVDVDGLEVVQFTSAPYLAVADVSVGAGVLLMNWYIGDDGELDDEGVEFDALVSASVVIELDERWNPLAISVDEAASIWPDLSGEVQPHK